MLLVRNVSKSQIDSRWSMTLGENRLVVSYSVGRVFAFVMTINSDFFEKKINQRIENLKELHFSQKNMGIIV
jgi:hypothetical protein